MKKTLIAKIIALSTIFSCYLNYMKHFILAYLNEGQTTMFINVYNEANVEIALLLLTLPVALYIFYDYSIKVLKKEVIE